MSFRRGAQFCGRKQPETSMASSEAVEAKKLEAVTKSEASLDDLRLFSS